jgi:dihydroneopterin aldolase
MDKLHVETKILCKIGKRGGQLIDVRASLSFDSSAAVISGRLADTINYKDVYNIIQEVAEQEHPLLEIVAEHMAQKMLTLPAHQVTISLSKLSAMSDAVPTLEITR